MAAVLVEAGNVLSAVRVYNTPAIYLYLKLNKLV